MPPLPPEGGTADPHAGRARTAGEEDRMISVGSEVPPRQRRGIYVLPSAFTVAGLFCGFYAIVRATQGSYQAAAWLILVAAVLDAIDGQVARMTRTDTDFGVQFDSLADVVSFGVAPAVLAHTWGLGSIGRIGWLVAFLYVACGAARLARFNLRRPVDRRYFVGLPIPAAALTIAAVVNYRPEPVLDPLAAGTLAVLVVFVAVLMISRLRYRSLKDLDVMARKPHLVIIAVALVYIAFASSPEVFLTLLAVTYLASGLVPKSAGRMGGRWAESTLGARDGGEGR
jgi:CDP-diacylglycerol--serine O-phosphatidyltransferase